MKNNVRTMEFVCTDNFSTPVYKCLETNKYWKDVSADHENPELLSCGDDIDGDPGYPIKPELKVVFKSKYKENPRKFDYQMLGRLKSDCDYYLGYGNRYAGHLYYKDEQEHIDEMKKLHNSFPEGEKPDWLTYEQILEYEKAMVCSK